ncbi:MAG: hypothetical protein SVS15_00145 [Thermodesulfobacteriota bacterium]|nr:hypothetical protein [Thermodesulfobacteriota bacterium]
MRPYPDGLDAARDLGEDVRRLSLQETQADFSEFEAVVADLPEGPGPELLKALRTSGKWTVVIDDAGNKIDWADVVLNDSILAENFEYPSGSRLLLGLQYLLLNEELEGFKRREKDRASERRVLITFGGSDPIGLTVKVLKAIGLKRYEKTAFNVILGPGYSDGEFKNAARGFRGSLTVHRNPESLLDFFSDCDLLVCAGGRTLYEAWSLGLPCLAVGGTEHESKVISAFLEKNMLLAGVVQWDPDIFFESFERALAGISAST